MNGRNKRRTVYVRKACLFVLSIILVISFGLSVEAKSTETRQKIKKAPSNTRMSSPLILKFKCPDSVKYSEHTKPERIPGPWEEGPATTRPTETNDLFSPLIHVNKMVCQYKTRCDTFMVSRPFPAGYICKFDDPSRTFICKQKK
jgi:hypothetical protein